ncbi:MAG: nucleotidyltransferase domain-containing protein [Verrucomicrobia bacterium]|nr:nucleotidyltransferase domain-containing protein [Verrucomicrobiota bacterium]
MTTNASTTATPPWAVTPEKLREAVRRLVEAAHPRRIILFGSHARGDAREDSDVDLMLIEDDVKDQAAESVRLRRVLKGLILPVDLLPVSRCDFDYWRDTPGNVFFEAATEGKVVYEAA